MLLCGLLITVLPSRTWDVAEYQEKAREKVRPPLTYLTHISDVFCLQDREAKEFAQEQEEAKRKGAPTPCIPLTCVLILL